MENLQKESNRVKSDHKTNEFFNTASLIIGLPIDSAKRVGKVILRDVVQRISPEEGMHFLSQLPTALKIECQDFISESPDKTIDAESIKKDILEVCGQKNINPEAIAKDFWDFLTTWLNNDPNEHKGITAKVLSQLPADIEKLLGRVVEH